MRFWNKCGEEWDGWKWFAGFIGRHTHLLSYSTAKRIDPASVSKNLIEFVAGFVTCFKNLLQQGNFSSDLVINVDDSPASPSQSRPTKFIGNLKLQNRSRIVANYSFLRSIVPFVAASDKVWMVVYIFKSVHEKDDKRAKKITVDNKYWKTRESYS
jgi:hypothetical protein